MKCPMPDSQVANHSINGHGSSDSSQMSAHKPECVRVLKGRNFEKIWKILTSVNQGLIMQCKQIFLNNFTKL